VRCTLMSNAILLSLIPVRLDRQKEAPRACDRRPEAEPLPSMQRLLSRRMALSPISGRKGVAVVGPSSRRTRVLAAATAAFVVLILAACAPQLEAPPPTPEPGAVQATDTAPAELTVAPTATPTQEPDAGGRGIRLTPTLLPSLERVPVSEPSPVTGEVPTELLEAILEDAEARTGIEAAEMDLLRAEAVAWNDGSLGCPQPDVMYTQAPVDGYWVVLKAEGKELDYRAAQSGHFSLCEHPVPFPGGAAAPTPEQ
jgi:hypothetical protein